ncbi:MAG: hypothetical protein GXP25_09675, partial [Planctomycetes bacterium]|nr:hypothetical protein [Planctomycetota bacterium]
FGRRRPWAGREFGPPTAFPEMSPLFRTMRGLRKVMGDLDDDQQGKVHEAMKQITAALMAFEGDLGKVLTQDQMKKYQAEKEAGPFRGPGERGGPGVKRNRPPRNKAPLEEKG